ncbi:MAG: hypothetical protein SNF33_00070 (plasmid) [Candidatus Algichlamydia australiensis]|nr:hypothetical protein [Chlamydiales bacterium]
MGNVLGIRSSASTETTTSEPPSGEVRTTPSTLQNMGTVASAFFRRVTIVPGAGPGTVTHEFRVGPDGRSTLVQIRRPSTLYNYNDTPLTEEEKQAYENLGLTDENLRKIDTVLFYTLMGTSGPAAVYGIYKVVTDQNIDNELERPLVAFMALGFSAGMTRIVDVAQEKGLTNKKVTPILANSLLIAAGTIAVFSSYKSLTDPSSVKTDIPLEGRILINTVPSLPGALGLAASCYGVKKMVEYFRKE